MALGRERRGWRARTDSEGGTRDERDLWIEGKMEGQET